MDDINLMDNCPHCQRKAELDRCRENGWVQERMYEKIIYSMDEGVHGIDAQGILRIFNPAQEKLDGYKACDVLGKHVTEVYKLDWQSSLLLKVLKEGKPILNYHQTYNTMAGKVVDIICSVFPIYQNGEVVGSVAITRDFTNFRNMAEKVLDLQESLAMRSLQPARKIEEDNGIKSFRQMVGNNRRLKEAVRLGEGASKTDSPVLICGETGVGKELFARCIHEQGKRAKGPFLAINCAAIPESLLEGILFGTEKGAFTGAVSRKGLLEQAYGGTLLLDEINSMPLALQAKLLRVLEEKKVRRLGGSEEHEIDVRIISSCNVEPMEAIIARRLRDDLFYRLAVVYIYIPPLRERMDDLESLTRHFIEVMNIQFGKNVKGLSPEVKQAFFRYDWPGNIRQLKNCIEGAMNAVAVDESLLLPHHIPEYLRMFPQQNKYPSAPKPEYSVGQNIFAKIEEMDKQKIIEALKQTNANITRAAALLGMSRQNLRYRLKKYGIERS
ncbi:MAG: arginine utilization regulatory protein [Thermoanaerobacteraceae bacterium]|nr:arginine utilization regulatory protein [Thermoanaerobacteraceae bacterium]